ncbi:MULTISPECIES: hypothetical protein [Listeria]|uniref:hypothetical protein n=1 Tax=Listeria TaxID=1637 RepID=UPI0013564203|nr:MULTISPECIES: hypothetical protein [Listeria]
MLKKLEHFFFYEDEETEWSVSDICISIVFGCAVVFALILSLTVLILNFAQ